MYTDAQQRRSYKHQQLHADGYLKAEAQSDERLHVAPRARHHDADGELWHRRLLLQGRLRAGPLRVRLIRCRLCFLQPCVSRVLSPQPHTRMSLQQ